MSKITKGFRVAALRRGIVVRPRVTTEVSQALTLSAAVEMANLGYIVRPEQIEGISVSGLQNMIADARKVVGADRKMRPIYPGFPKQVQELDTLTLLIEQILHYWTGGEFLPDYPEVQREALALEDSIRRAVEVKVLPASEAARALVEDLVTQGVAMSDAEREVVVEGVKVTSMSLDDAAVIVSRARNHENVQVLVAALNDLGRYTANEIVAALAPSVRSVDSLLRLILAVATEPVTNRVSDYERAVKNLADRKATAVRMKTLSRPVRRLVLARLGALTGGFKADALVARKNLWRRILRMVHPYDLSPDAASKRAADIVHDNVQYSTLNSRVEAALAAKNATEAVSLLAEHAPGNLLRRLVHLMRISTAKDARALATAVKQVGASATLTTLISAYNGVLAADDPSGRARITRVAGLRNTMRKAAPATPQAAINAAVLTEVTVALKAAIGEVLAKKDAPVAPVGTDGARPVPLVRRDLATTDRVMDRGEVIPLAGDGNTIRFFNHWRNNQRGGGYMDTGIVVLDANYENLAVVDWSSWMEARDWSTYSGDCLVHVGEEAAEYIDVDLEALRKEFPKAAMIAMTIQSYSGFPTKDVDIIAGVMLRSKPDSGEVFDPRSLVTAFKPTTEALQSVPLVVHLDSKSLIWIDSSSGSSTAGMSAVNDSTVGDVVYDEIARPRLTMGELAELWAQAHGVETVDAPVDREALLALLD